MSLPSNDTSDPVEAIVATVAAIKQERDTWRAVAESYRTAFEDHTTRLQELQNIYFATQAELENERNTTRRSRQTFSEISQVSMPATNSLVKADDKSDNASSGTSTIYEESHADVSWRPNVCFRRVEHFNSQCDYGTALKEVDHLLCGPLSPQTRVEGLLLKSNVMRKSERPYDALAACSEALELCNRIVGLHVFLPRIQYQRGMCLYHLRMTKQAREAFDDICADDDLLHTKAAAMRDSCREQLQGRRSGFEAHRTVTEGLLAQFYENTTIVWLRVLLEIDIC
jgi:hypothetical protein